MQAFELQAADYLLKPVQPARLASCLARLQARLQVQQEQRPDAAPPFEELVGRLQQLMQAAEPAARRPSERLEVIAAQQGAVTEMVPVDEIIYFEAADKYLRVVTARREHLVRLSLRELLGQLDEQRFWRIHRGAVVQARCIARAVRDSRAAPRWSCATDPSGWRSAGCSPGASGGFDPKAPNQPSISSSVRATTFVARRRSSSTRCSSARLALDSRTVRGPAP